MRPIRRHSAAMRVSSGIAPSRSWTFAAVTTTASSSPMVSTAMCLFVPSIFFAPS
jgi:hypothetical protein